MPTNPRIEDLKRRLEREPGSRLFAQLAEELRRGGELMEAIRVAKEGLQKHPAYVTARMTLGRALMDFGDLEGARTEFASVLKAAPENILASRFRAECEEGLGNIEGAVAQYRTTLALAPGDPQLRARLDALEKRLQTESEGPIPVSEVPPDRALDFEAAPPPGIAREPAELPPLPLASADETFELERPYDAQGHYWVAGQTEAAAPPASPSAPAGRGPAGQAPEGSGLGFGIPAFEFSAEAPAPPRAADLRDRSAEWAPGPPAAVLPGPPGAPGVDEMASPTLAEIYFNQGLHEKAIETYRQVLGREPRNERARARLLEIEALQKYLRAEEELTRSRDARTEGALGRASEDERRARRETLERSISRLQGFLAAIKRG